MTRLAFGAKWSELSAPFGFSTGFATASAPNRSRRNKALRAMAPRPVVLRARNARRVRVRSISVWRNIVESASRVSHPGSRDARPKTQGLLFCNRLVQIEQYIRHSRHRRKFDLVHCFGQLRLADGQQALRTPRVGTELGQLLFVGVLQGGDFIGLRQPTERVSECARQA